MTATGDSTDPQWRACDRADLRARLLQDRAPVSGTHRQRLAWAVARRDLPEIRAIAQHPGTLRDSALDCARLAAAQAAFGALSGWDRLSADYRFCGDEWATRIAAAAELGRAPSVLSAGSVALDLTHGLPLVKARVDDRAEGWFVLDSGAPHALLAEAWVQRNGLALVSGIAHHVEDGSGNQIDAVTTRVGSVALGAVARDVPAIVAALPPGLEVAGILSPLDLFPEHAIAFDFAQGRLTVSDGLVAERYAVPLFWEAGVPLLPARAMGRPAFLMLDTGAGGEILCEDFARTVDLVASARATTNSAAGEIPIGLADDVAFAVSDSPEELLPIAIKPCRSSGPDVNYIGQDGLLGMGWMRGRRLLVSANRRGLSFSDRELQ